MSCHGELTLFIPRYLGSSFRSTPLWTHPLFVWASNMPKREPALDIFEVRQVSKRLRTMDLADMRKKRRPLGKAAYTARAKGVMRSQRAQAVAVKWAGRLRKACQEVVARKGAAADN